MTSSAIVEHFDIVEQVGLGILPGRVDAVPHSLLLETAEERLRGGVVIAVPPPAHARLQPVGAAESGPVVAVVLRPLIGVDDDPAGGPALPDRHEDRVKHQVALERGLHRPPYHHARVQVDDDGEIEESLVSADVGDVTNPGMIGIRRQEILREQVRRRRCRPTRSKARLLAADVGCHAVLPHDPRHAMLSAGLAGLAQVPVNPRAAVRHVARLTRQADQPEKPRILTSSDRLRLLEPRVETTPMHPKNATHRGDPKLPAMITDERVPYRDALAKYAAAFFRMSRSSSTRLGSAFNRAFSRLTASRAPAALPPRSARTQRKLPL